MSSWCEQRPIDGGNAWILVSLCVLGCCSAAQSNGEIPPVEVIHEELPSDWQPTTDDLARGYVMFALSPLELVLPSRRPTQSEVKDSPIRLRATPGEHVVACIAVRALRHIERLGLTALPFRDERGGTGLNAEANLRQTQWMPKRLARASWLFMYLPAFLAPSSSAAVSRGQTKEWLLLLDIPSDARPGLYDAGLTLHINDSPVDVWPVSLQILPFTLADGPLLPVWGVFVDTSWAERQSATQVGQSFAIMRDAGLTSVGIWVDPPREAFVCRTAECAFDPDPAAPFVKTLLAYKTAGFPRPPLLNCERVLAWSQDWAASEPALERTDAYAGMIKAVNGWLERIGVRGTVFHVVEEAAWQGERARDRCLWALSVLRREGIRCAISGPVDEFLLARAAPSAAVILCNGSLPSEALAQTARQNGCEIWLYNVDVEWLRPEVMRLAGGYCLWVSGARGLLNWQYQGRSGDSLYNDLDGAVADSVAWYPPDDTRLGGPSLSWEGFRQGILDFRYLLTLDQQISAASRQGLREEASCSRDVMRDCLSSLIGIKRLRGAAQWQYEAGMITGRPAVGGTLKLPIDWDFQEYDRTRWRVGEEVARLSAFLQGAESRERRRRNGRSSETE